MINVEDITNKIICADCIDILKQLPDKCVDLVLTDPPYEQEMHGGYKQGLAQSYQTVKTNTEFMNYGYDYESVLPELIRVCKIPNIIIFCSNAQIAKTMGFFEDKGLTATLLIWQKTNPAPLGNGKYLSDIEYVVYVRGKNSTFNDVPLKMKYKIKSYPFVADKEHPAQKPVGLISEYLKTHSNENDIVLDCFSGSGTTAVACHKLKRRFICIEKDPDYWAASVKRLEDVQKQGELF